ncbi:MAG: hypothetical protein LUG12_12010 [Erysipelotrichaceae bacterium]|nr:hypothetical protein [Erysipelotrichaceae bacterium]
MKKLIIHIVLQFLYRGMKVLYKDDKRVHEELDGWKEDKTIVLKVRNGPHLTMKYTYQKGLSKIKQDDGDIVITFKSVNGAFKVFAGMMSVKQAYLEHAFVLKGDIYESMRFVRCVDLVETYLFPRFMTRRILNHEEKRYQPMLLVYLKALIA